MPTVSNAEAEGGAVAEMLPDEYVRLERSVRRLLDEMAGYRARAQVAEGKASELERALQDVTSGALDPMKLRDGLRRLEEENRELRRRMVQAQDRIRRLIARFDFLEEEL
jgi:predicted RNase H-like nuclease (RuvC/YqgF family)